MAQEGNLWFSIGADNTQFQRTARDTNKRLTEMSNNVKAFSKGISASFVEAAKSMAGFYSVAKAGTLFQELIHKNDQFNKSMREVSTLSEDVAKNLDSYKRQILDLSTQIPIAADDAAKALYQINSAGHTGAEGMKVLEVSAKAAIGGVTDTLTAADTITTVLNAYKMASSDAASVSDKLFTAVKLGKTSMSELGASIAQVAPMAATFGISIDQVLSAIATLTKNGTPTAQAVTQIRAAIVSLSDAFGSAYFQTHTLQQGMIDMRNSVPADALKKTVGTIEAYNGILAMTGQNAKGAAEDLREFQNSSGAASQAYDQMNRGKGVELAKLQNNIMKEMADVNNKISETIANVAKKMNEAFDTGRIDSFLETMKELIAVYGIYKAAAITVAASQTALSSVNEMAAEAEMAEIQKLIAFKNAEVIANGEVSISEKTVTTEREASLIAARTEAKEVLANIRNKAQEAAANLAAARSQEAIAKAHVMSAETGVEMRKREMEAALATGDGLKYELAERRYIEAEMHKEDAQRALSTASRKTESAAIASTNAQLVLERATVQADSIAQTQDAVATGVLAKAKLALTSALNKLKVAMASNPWTVALIAVTALGYAVYKFIGYVEDNKKKQAELNAEIEKTTKAGDRLKRSLNDLKKNGFEKQKEEVSDMISKYETLRQKWIALGDDLNKKKKFINDNQQAFHDLGFSVNDVLTAENLLVKNTDAVVAAMTARAQAVALQELATEAYKERIKSEMDVNNKTSKYRRLKKGDTSRKLNTYEKQELLDAVKAGRIKNAGKVLNMTGERELSAEAIDYLNKFNQNRLLQRRQQGIQDIRKKTDEYIDAINDQAKKSAEEAKRKMKAAGIEEYDGSNVSGSGTSTTADDDKKTKSDKEAERRQQELERQKEVSQQLYQELLELQAKNEDDRIALMKDGHAKRMEEINNDYQKELSAIREQATKWAKENKTSGMKQDEIGSSITIGADEYINLTKIQAEELQKSLDLMNQKKQKATDDELLMQESAMNEYLIKYGTLQEQRVALNDKYTKLIAESATEGQKLALQKEWDTAISELESETFKSSINWDSILGDVASKTKAQLTDAKDKLSSMLSSGQYDGKIDQLKTLIDALSKIDSALADKGEVFTNISTAARNLATAQTDLKSKEMNLALAIETGNAAAIKAAQSEVTLANNRVSGANNALNASKKAIVAFNKDIKNALNGDMDSIVNVTKEALAGFDEIFKTNISGLFDELGEEFTQLISETVSNIASIISIIRSANVDTTARDQEIIYNNLMYSIDNLTEEIKNSSLSDALEAYNKQLESLENVTVTAQNSLSTEMQRSNSNTALDINHRSANYYINKRMNDSDWQAISKLTGKTITSAGELWMLSPEQLVKIKDSLYDIFSKIESGLKDVKSHAPASDDYDNAQDALDNYMEIAGKLETLTDTIQNKLTSISFDEITDNFKSMLMDLDSSMEDFSDDFAKKLANSILNIKLSENGGINDKLKQWYNSWIERATTGEEMTPDEIAKTKEEYQAIVQEGIDLRNQIAALTGYDETSSQKATANGIESITEDTAQELNGRFTALQIAGENISNNAALAITHLMTIGELQGVNNAYLSDILSQHALTNTMIEDIVKYQKGLYNELSGKVQKILDNTDRI